MEERRQWVVEQRKKKGAFPPGIDDFYKRFDALEKEGAEDDEDGDGGGAKKKDDKKKDEKKKEDKGKKKKKGGDKEEEDSRVGIFLQGRAQAL